MQKSQSMTGGEDCIYREAMTSNGGVMLTHTHVSAGPIRE